jgi:hypothetical protein
MTPERIYKLLLNLYPREFREQYGEEMTRVFQESLCSEGSSFGFWIRTILDTISSAGSEQWRNHMKKFLVRETVITIAGLGLLNLLNGFIRPDFDWSGNFIGPIQFIAFIGLFFVLSHAKPVLEIIGLLLLLNLYMPLGLGLFAGWLSLLGFLVLAASQIQRDQSGWHVNGLTRGLLLWFTARLASFVLIRFEVASGYRAENVVLAFFWLLEGVALLALAWLAWSQSRSSQVQAT